MGPTGVETVRDVPKPEKCICLLTCSLHINPNAELPDCPSQTLDRKLGAQKASAGISSNVTFGGGGDMQVCVCVKPEDTLICCASKAIH